MRGASWLLVALLLWSSAAWGSATPGETCSISGDGPISCSVASCTLGGTLASSGCTDTGGDDLLVFSGAVTVDGDITQDATSAAGLSFLDGSSLTVDTSDAGDARVLITLGPAGLTRAGDASVDTQGRWVHGAATPTWETSPEWMAVSDWIPCPVVASTQAPAGSATSGPYEPDCTNGNANHLLVQFSEDASSSSESGYRFVSETLGALTANESELCGGQADDTSPVRDAWACYDVVAVNTSELFVLIDVRQGAAASSYALARRDFQEFFLAAQLDAGGRVVEIDDGAGGSVFAVDHYLNGRWVACEDTANGDADGCGDADGVACRVDLEGQFRLGLTFDAADYFASGSNDTLYTASPVAKTYPDNTRCWATYGQLEGETVAFRNPVKIVSATAPATDDDDSRIIFDGTNGALSLKATTLDGLATNIDLPDNGLLEWVWFRDVGGQSSCDTGRVLDMSATTGLTIRYTSRSGGMPGASPCDRVHGFGAPNATTISNLTLEGLRFRHGGDDDIVFSGGSTVTDLLLRRSISEYAADNAQSKGLFDPQTAAVFGQVYDLACFDCTSRDNVTGHGNMVGGGGGSGNLALRGLLYVGSHGPVTNTSPWSGKNIKAISNISVAVPGAGPWPSSGVVENIVVDQWLAPNDSAGSVLLGVANDWRKFIVRRSEVRSQGAVGISVSNVTLEDGWMDGNIVGEAGETVDDCVGQSDTACTMIALSGSPSNVHLKRIGIRAGADSGVCRTVNLTGTSGNAGSGLLLMDQSETGAGCRALHGSASTTDAFAANAEAPWCFYGNLGTSGTSSDVTPASEGTMPAGSLRGVRPLFLDDARDRELVRPGSPVAAAGCGPAADTGVPVRIWADVFAGLNADCLGCGEWGGLGGGGGSGAWLDDWLGD